MNNPGEYVVDSNGTKWMVLAVGDLHLSSDGPSTCTVTLWREGFDPIDVEVEQHKMLPRVDEYRATATISEQLGAEPLNPHAAKILEMQKYLRDRLGGAEYQRRVNELWGRGRGRPGTTER